MSNSARNANNAFFNMNENNNANVRNTGNNAKSNNSNVKVANNSKNNSGTGSGVFKVIAVVIVMIVIVIITFWIVNKLRKGSRSEKILIDDKYIQLDDNKSVPKVIDADDMESPANGNEMTYNFWIHLADNYDSSSSYKLVFFRGNMTDNSTSTSIEFSSDTGPIVVMDKTTNKMMIAIATTNSPASTLNNIFREDSEAKYLKTYIDYVPLQRWVNISIAIIDNTMRVYLDGDIYSVVSTNEMGTNRGSLKPSEGPLQISHSSNQFKVKGHISKLRYYNHMLSQDRIRGLYRRGPFPKTWLNMLGIQKYGVQSPIYKIE